MMSREVMTIRPMVIDRGGGACEESQAPFFVPFLKGSNNAGFPCRGHNNPTLLVLRRASNHSPNLSPIVGKRLKKIIAETAEYF